MIDVTIQEPLPTPEAPSPAEDPLAALVEALVPVPSTSAVSSFRSHSVLSRVVCDERAIGRLLETIIHRSGLSIEEVSRRLGVHSNTVRQYLAGRRRKPSLLWFVKLANLCGSSVTVEFPKGSLR